MTRNTEDISTQSEAGVWLVSECPIENGTLLKTERVVSLHATADEALAEVRRQGKIMRDNDLRGYLYGYKFYPVPGLLAQQPAPASTKQRPGDAFQALRDALPEGAAEARLEVYLEEQREAAREAALLATSQQLMDAARNVLHRAEECGFTRELVVTDFSLSLSQLRAALSAAEAPAGRDG